MDIWTFSSFWLIERKLFWGRGTDFISLEIELLGHMVYVYIFKFVRNFWTVSYMAVPFLVPTSNIGDIQLFQILIDSWYCKSLILVILVVCSDNPLWF